MLNILRFIAALIAVTGLATIDASVFAQGKGRDKDKQEQQDKGKGGGQQKAKKQHHKDGKALLGDKIKQNGKHAFHTNGKFTATADVQNGKIRGVSVKHSEKGDVPVKKYKAKEKPQMARASSGIMPANFVLAQAQYLGTTWIGYSYIDDYGDEQIYWFPYDMIYDGDTGAIDYVPQY